MDKPLQRIDHIMWDAETPNSPATITGMMVFRKKLNKLKVAEIIEKRLLRYERFRRKVVIKDGKPMWHLDEQFQLLTHIHHVALPGKGGYTELQEFISDLISQPLNSNKPLWDIHLVDNYNHGSVLVWRLHHAIGDGMALVQVIFSLTGISAAESLAIPSIETNTKSHSTIDELFHLIDLGQSAFDDAKYLATHPTKLLENLKKNVMMAKEIGGLLVGKPIDNKLYKGRLGASKKAAWTKPLPLADFKALAVQHGTKINDVMVALVAGAIRKHMLMHKLDTSKGIRIVMPVSTHKNLSNEKLHNQFAWMMLDLPVNEANFIKRLKFIRDKTIALKPTAESAFVNELVHIVADFIPSKPKLKLLDFLGTRIGASITNVPGAKEPIYFAGSKIEDLVFWLPHTVPLGIGISLHSYNGKVTLGTAADELLIRDPDFIVNEFTKEFQKAVKNLAPKVKTTRRLPAPKPIAN